MGVTSLKLTQFSETLTVMAAKIQREHYKNIPKM